MAKLLEPDQGDVNKRETLEHLQEAWERLPEPIRKVVAHTDVTYEKTGGRILPDGQQRAEGTARIQLKGTDSNLAAAHKNIGIRTRALLNAKPEHAQAAQRALDAAHESYAFQQQMSERQWQAELDEQEEQRRDNELAANLTVQKLRLDKYNRMLARAGLPPVTEVPPGTPLA